jgi:hypothetical protein
MLHQINEEIQHQKPVNYKKKNTTGVGILSLFFSSLKTHLSQLEINNTHDSYIALLVFVWYLFFF